jgi:hypothetical protein
MVTKSKKVTKKDSKFDYKTIKTFEDACKKAGVDPNITPVSQHIPEEFRKPIIAAYRLLVIYKAINNGWKPDWSSWNQYKHYPWYRVLSSGFGFSHSDCGCGHTTASVSSRLCTDSAEKALFIAEQFKSEYQDYFLYSK